MYLVVFIFGGCLNCFQLELALESLRRELKEKETSENQILSRMRVDLKKAQQQQELVTVRKKQLRDQLMEATKALQATRVRNEEVQRMKIYEV